jgi:hypothetical protein
MLKKFNQNDIPITFETFKMSYGKERQRMLIPFSGTQSENQRTGWTGIRTWNIGTYDTSLKHTKDFIFWKYVLPTSILRR